MYINNWTQLSSVIFHHVNLYVENTHLELSQSHSVIWPLGILLSQILQNQQFPNLLMLLCCRHAEQRGQNDFLLCYFEVHA